MNKLNKFLLHIIILSIMSCQKSTRIEQSWDDPSIFDNCKEFVWDAGLHTKAYHDNILIFSRYDLLKNVTDSIIHYRYTQAEQAINKMESLSDNFK